MRPKPQRKLFEKAKRFTGRKIFCTCCRARWVDARDTLTKPCECDQFIRCQECERCLNHCDCVELITVKRSRPEAVEVAPMLFDLEEVAL